MGKSPTTQVMNCEIKMEADAVNEKKDIFGITLKTVNWVNDLNAIPSSIYNGVLADALTLDAFANAGLNVSSVQVTGSKWISDGGKLAWTFQLTTVSDPVTAADIIALILGISSVLFAFLFAALGPETAFIGDLLLVGFALAGLFTIAAVTCTIVSSSGGATGLLTGSTNQYINAAVILGLIAVSGIGIYMYFREPKRQEQAKRYVAKAKSKAKSIAKRLI